MARQGQSTHFSCHLQSGRRGGIRPSPGGSLGQEQCGCGELPGSLPDVFPNRDPHTYYSKSLLDLALGSGRCKDGKLALLSSTC